MPVSFQVIQELRRRTAEAPRAQAGVRVYHDLFPIGKPADFGFELEARCLVLEHVGHALPKPAGGVGDRPNVRNEMRPVTRS